MDHGSGEMSLQHRASTQNTTSKYRWSQQENQRLQKQERQLKGLACPQPPRNVFPVPRRVRQAPNGPMVRRPWKRDTGSPQFACPPTETD